MLKVLAIYPAFDCAINEMAAVWARLCEKAELNCTVVTNIDDRLKANVARSSRETLNNLEIHRFNAPLSTGKVLKQIVNIANEFHPDVIFCAVYHNLPVAHAVQNAFPAPICLHTEYFLDVTYGLRRRAYLGLKWLRPIAHYWHRVMILSQCQMVLCSNPKEFITLVTNKKLWYLPWPIINTNLIRTYNQRNLNQVIYIGSLSQDKGVIRLVDYLLALLKEYQDFEIVLVGPKIDKTARRAIATLQQEGKNRVKLFDHCSKEKALDLIASSLCVISPGQRFGWGIIGDAWTTGTPVITAGLHYDLLDGVNCIFAPDVLAFLGHVYGLKSDKSLWTKLSDGGLTAAASHDVDVVATMLLEGLRSTLRAPAIE